MTNDKQWQELQALFQSEAEEYLDTMNQSLLQLETTAEPDQMLLNELFRVAHSLKGAARTVNRRAIEQVAHALESVFAAIRDHDLQLTPQAADVLYDALDSIQILMSGDTKQLNLEGVLANLYQLVEEETPVALETIPAALSSPLSTEETQPREEMIRVPVSKLDSLMVEVSNMLVSRMNIEQRVLALKDLRERHRQWQRHWRSIHTHYIRLIRASTQRPESVAEWKPLLDFMQNTQQHMRQVGRLLNELEQTLNEDSLALGITADGLQGRVRDLRLLPFDTIVAGLQRMVRDVARDLGKDIMFRTVGTRIELDKQVLENIKDPLMHLLRNAIDHGIESPETRKALEKPEQGMILLTLMQRGNKVHIIVSDDGHGIDPVQVLEQAQERRLITAEEAQSLNEIEILELLMLPGMSTSEAISAISGRGVGLDVVHQKVEALQGQVRIESRIGEGTTFEIILPVSLSTLHCLLVKIGPETYAIPTSAVERVLVYEPENVYMVKGKTMLTVNERPVPLAYLEEVLERRYHRDSVETGALALVLSAAERHYAFVVDDVLGEQEVIVRSLNAELARVRNVRGATLLANGQVVIILNVNDLIKSALGKTIRRREIAPPEPEAPPAPCVLVVDDSITTRTLQKNILETAGFTVLTATHGAEALDILSSQDVDLVISDIEMPWIDGFELTVRIRKHPQLKNLPVVLVTSLDAAEHKQRGIEAGADAYIAKGVFDQNELLSTIQTLL